MGCVPCCGCLCFDRFCVILGDVSWRSVVIGVALCMFVWRTVKKYVVVYMSENTKEFLFSKEYFELIKAVEAIDNRSTTIKGFSSTFFAGVFVAKEHVNMLFASVVALIFCSMCWYIDAIWCSRKRVYIETMIDIERCKFKGDFSIWQKLRSGNLLENKMNVAWAARWRTVAFPHVLFVAVTISNVSYELSKSIVLSLVLYSLLHVVAVYMMYIFKKSKVNGKKGEYDGSEEGKNEILNKPGKVLHCNVWLVVMLAPLVIMVLYVFLCYVKGYNVGCLSALTVRS